MKTRTIVLLSTLVSTLWLSGSMQAQDQKREAGGGLRSVDQSGTFGASVWDTPRPMYLRGKVLLEDGSPLSGVNVELLCHAGVRRQVVTLADGSFSLDITARSNRKVLDASARGGGNWGDLVSNSPSRSSHDMAMDLSSCELHAVLPGFKSDQVFLGRRRPLDNSELPPIVMRRLAKVQGTTISLTTAKAPKKAMKSFEKANKELGKKKVKYSKVAKELEKAVKVYPEFAAAWHLLGEARLRLNDEAPARKAFQQSIQADPAFIKPLMSLIVLEADGNRWPQVSQLSEQVLKLNPYFIPVHFYRALANYGQGRISIAEESIRELRKGGEAEAFPANYYVMGAIFASRGDLPSAAKEFEQFLEAAPEGPFAERVRQQMASWKDRGLI